MHAMVEHGLSAITLAILAIVFIQSLISISPDLYWASDPRSELSQTSITELGPTAIMWLNVTSVALAALALLFHALKQKKVSFLACGLALVGIAASFYHIPRHAESLWRCSIWIAAVSTGVAMMHLAQHERQRRMIVAGLMALIVPLAAKAIWYVTVDYPDLVKMFTDQMGEILHSRGWAPGSPQALMYERRLRSPDATGYYGLSNVFGSILAALTLLSMTLAAGWLSARRWSRAVLPLLLGSAAIVGVSLTLSKGAAGVTLLGLLLLTAFWKLRHRLFGVRVMPFIAIVCVMGVCAAVLIRGAIGPPKTAEGERSLLFRYQYWQAAVWMMADPAAPPLRRVLGVGPGNFQSLYSFYKNPLNPEEVTSTHNVEIDFAVMLGLGGIVWVVLLVWWLFRSFRGAVMGFREESVESSRPPPLEIRISDLLWAGGLGLAVFGTQYIYLREMLSFLPAIVWIVSAAGFVLVMSLFLSPGVMKEQWIGPALAMAALVLLIHSQIEMTFYHQGAVILAFMIVGAAAGNITSKSSRMKWYWVNPLIFVIVAVVLIFAAAIPVTQQQRDLRDAASALQKNRIAQAQSLLRQASDVLPTDPRPAVEIMRLSLEEASREADNGDLQQAGKLLDSVLVEWRLPPAVLDDFSFQRTQAQIVKSIGRFLNREQRMREAVSLWQRLTQRNPYNLSDRLHLADLLWQLGDLSAAREEYQRVLAMNAQTYLDPLRQLSEEKRMLVESRAK